MQEIVNKVLEAEQQADQLLAKAREEAAALRAAADAETARNLQEAREQAHRLIQENIAQTREEAEREHRETIRAAEEEAGRFIERKREALEQVVDRVVALIIAPEFEKG